MDKRIVKFLLIFFIFIYNNSVIADATIITWDDLSPAKGEQVKRNIGDNTEIIGIPDISEFGGSQESFDIFLDDMKFLKEMQGDGGFINMNLNNKKIKIAGYIAPITFDGENITEFLFVPYRGACIHVPPPPPNQIIYVKSASGLRADDMWSPQWITGILTATPVSTFVADVGYSIQEASVTPYKAGFGLFD